MIFFHRRKDVLGLTRNNAIIQFSAANIALRLLKEPLINADACGHE